MHKSIEELTSALQLLTAQEGAPVASYKAIADKDRSEHLAVSGELNQFLEARKKLLEQSLTVSAGQY